MRRFASGVLLALVALAVPAQQKVADPKAALAESLLLYGKGDYVAAIDRLEPAFALQDLDFGFQDDMSSTEAFLARLYVRANQVERGIAYFHGLFVGKRKGKSNADARGYSYVEETLLDLALRGKRLDIALEVCDERKRREDYPGWDLDYARIHVAQGDVAAALGKLTSYLEYEYADSRTRILARPDFAPLHGNAEFQRLVTETDALEQARRDKARKEAREAGQPMFEGAAPKPAATFAEIRAAAEVYKKVTEPAAARPLLPELRASDELVFPNLERFQGEILELLRAEKKSPYYRLTLARYLANLQDAALTKQVATEVKDDSFLAFPQQLFRLAYAIASVDPEAARPFLLQMLQGANASVSLPQHAMSVDWDGLLVQVFGFVEAHYREDLLRWATAGEAPQNAKATMVLLALQEPALVPILVGKLEAAKPEQRQDLVKELGGLYLPQARAALQDLLASGRASGDEAKLVREILDGMQPPEPRMPRDPDLTIVDPQLRAIFFDNLARTCGMDVSYVEPTLWSTAKPEDIPKLLTIRSRILARFSDEAFGDWSTVSSIITWLRWQ
jgi:hypothetical protein